MIDRLITNRYLAKGLAWFIVIIYKPLKVLIGDKAREILGKVADFAGKTRAKPIAEKLRINTERADELGKIQDFEDEIFGVEGEWEKKSEDEAIKIERKCPFAKFLDGEFCRTVVYRFETSTFKNLNPNYTLEIKGKLLSEKGDACIFIHRIKKEREISEDENNNKR